MGGFRRYGFMTFRRLLTGLLVLDKSSSDWNRIGGTTGRVSGGSGSEMDFFLRLKKDDGFLERTCVVSLGGGGGGSRGGVARCCGLI